MAYGKPRKLVKINVTEVSLVARAANREEVLLAKSDYAALELASERPAPANSAPSEVRVGYDISAIKRLLASG